MRHKVNTLTLIAIASLSISLVLAPGTPVTKVGAAGMPAPRPTPGVIEPGIDMYTTPCGGASYLDFSAFGLGPDFFGTGSDSFTERVNLKGLPLSAAYGTTDTIVRRTEPADVRNPGDSASVHIEMVALSLVGCDPIKVFYGGVERERWDLSVTVAEPTQGTMTISNTCGFENGGTFNSSLVGFPILVFTRVVDPTHPPTEPKTLDFRQFQIPWFFDSFGQWSSSAPARFNLITVPESSGNFFPGIWNLPCLEGNCGSSVAAEVMIQESWKPRLGKNVFAVHSMLPAAPLSPDSDADGIPDAADNCPAIPNPLQADRDGDGKGDECDSNPTHYDPACTVVIDGCDSGVPNHVFDGGTSFNDKIADCATHARNHGQFESCVSHLLNEWRSMGLITQDQRTAIKSCAVHAHIP